MRRWLAMLGTLWVTAPATASPLLSEADRAYYEAFGLSPEEPGANHVFAIELMGRRRWSLALGHLETALAGSPDDHDARARYGEVLLQLNRPEEAEIELKKVLGSGSDSESRAHSLLGRLASRRGDREIALGHYRAAATLNPDEAFPHFNLGLSLIRNGHRAEGVEELGRAVELDPDWILARRKLATGLAELGRHREAMGHLDFLLEYNPEDPVALYELADAQEALGDPQLARETRLRSLEIAKASPRYQRLRQQLEEKLATPKP